MFQSLEPERMDMKEFMFSGGTMAARQSMSGVQRCRAVCV